MQLDTDGALFIQQTIIDLEFVNSTLEMLTEKFLANMKFYDREAEADNFFDIEWQLSQLLNEIANSRSPFFPGLYPEMRNCLAKIKKNSEKRQSLIEASCVPLGRTGTEPVVSRAELSGLLGTA